MHYALSEKEFKYLRNLVFEKWESLDCETSEFLKYFKREWVTTNPNWYHGYCLGKPITNNALEAINATIKRDHTFRKRLPLGNFFNFLKTWSVIGQ